LASADGIINILVLVYNSHAIFCGVIGGVAIPLSADGVD
jgi:hypothetical protein